MNCIILSIGDIFEGILIVIVAFLGFFVLFGLIPQWLSHKSGYGIRTRFGGKIADPSDWNNTKEAFSTLTHNIKDSSINIYNKIRKYNASFPTLIQDRSVHKLDKLYIINDLKLKGIITEQEFDQLKNEILN